MITESKGGGGRGEENRNHHGRRDGARGRAQEDRQEEEEGEIPVAMAMHHFGLDNGIRHGGHVLLANHRGGRDLRRGEGHRVAQVHLLLPGPGHPHLTANQGIRSRFTIRIQFKLEFRVESKSKEIGIQIQFQLHIQFQFQTHFQFQI